MGVRGFQTYIAESGLLVEHRLQDTILVIDGLNLENELYSRFLRRHDDKDYAGDYASFALYVEAFFKALLRCGVTPVVIMDGSFEDDKREKKLERFDQRLKTAKAIYEGTSTGSEEINSLLNSYMFVQVIRRLKIAVYKSILEADDILPTIAADLNAPILSGDSDFLLENVSAGVINTKSFLLDDFQVHGGTGAADRPYLKCQLYRLSALQSKFRGLKAELVPIGGAILGNDYFDFNEAKDVINRLPKDRAAPRQKSFRFHQIHTVFSWLATQSTPAAVKAYLQRLVGAHHRMVQCIEDRYMGPPLKAISAPRGQSIAAYFSANYERLFPQEQSGGMPRWAHQRLVEEQLQKRAVSIFCGQVEFLRPLVEDYSLTDSSCQASFEL
ncbi:PREDICTED: protein asteroid homolog 1-like, partial [Rhagoletis zephyria]|uniref:protein asteroid homolog 1-like n=1 Tax=Rhagoletis zephyria TaxID=28612 RepID=UPI000811278D